MIPDKILLNLAPFKAVQRSKMSLRTLKKLPDKVWVLIFPMRRPPASLFFRHISEAFLPAYTAGGR